MTIDKTRPDTTKLLAATRYIRLSRGACFMDVELIAKGTLDEVVRLPNGKMMTLLDLFGSGWVIVRRYDKWTPEG